MVVTLGLVACNKDDAALDNAAPKQKVLMQEEMIPIAKLNDKGEIELLFLQRDVQEFFYKENPDEKLVFVEVQDDNKDGENAGLLYRIFNEKNEVMKTSISMVVTLEKGVYYVPLATTLQNSSISFSFSCATSDPTCMKTTSACRPEKKGDRYYCTDCPNNATCKASASPNNQLTQLVRAIDYAVLAYAMY